MAIKCKGLKQIPKVTFCKNYYSNTYLLFNNGFFYFLCGANRVVINRHSRHSTGIVCIVKA